MPRLRSHRAASAAPTAARRILTNRDKPAYKVVFEEITQKKKKLITAGSFQANPPAGYTFIPAGDPQITNRCKDIARKDGAKVYAVSTTKHRHSGLSKQVHRIGYHFPSAVVGRACLSLGVDLSRDGRVLRYQHDWAVDNAQPAQEHRTRLNLLNQNSSKLSQATIDTQAREAIRDLFPKIPDKDLRDIVTHAFELGKARVGTASELPLPRRVQLAVVAHIRHTYTDYDRLLKQVPWQAARAMIEQASLNKLAQWRGDDDDEPDAMEDILREIIVIPDDDDDNNDDEDANQEDNNITQRRYTDHHDSVDVVTSHNIVDVMETIPIDYSNPRAGTQGPESPQSDDNQEVIFLGNGQYFLDRPDQARSKRHRDHRHRAWEEARDRFRRPIAQPRSPLPRPLPQAFGIVDDIRTKRDSREQIERLPQQQQRPSNREITSIHEPQHFRSSTIEQATHHSIADNDHRRPVYVEQTRSFGHLTNPFKAVERQDTGRYEPREYQSVQHIPTQSSSPSNRIYMESERKDYVNSFHISPTSYEQIRVSKRNFDRPEESPTSKPENSLQFAEKLAYPMPQTQQFNQIVHTDSPVPPRYVNSVETRRGSHLYRMDNDMNDMQQLVKRRRIDKGNDIIHDQDEVPNDLQNSLLIPVSHNERYEPSDHMPTVLHRTSGLDPSIRTVRPDGTRIMHKVTELNQQDVPPYRPIYTEHVSSSGTQFPHHRQVLISKQTSSRISARSPISQGTIPEFDTHVSVQNMSYGPQSSYISLPRQDLRTSSVVADDLYRRAAQGSVPWDENIRNQRRVFGHPSDTEGHAPSQSVLSQNKPRPSAEQSEFLVRELPADIQTHRARRLLPLERSLEQLGSFPERIPTKEIVRLQGSLKANNYDRGTTPKTVPKSQVSWPQMQLQRDSHLGYAQHDERPRSFDIPVQDGTRLHILHNSEVEPHRDSYPSNMPQEITLNPYRPVVRVHPFDSQPRRVLDKHAGKEVIVLE